MPGAAPASASSSALVRAVGIDGVPMREVQRDLLFLAKED